MRLNNKSKKNGIEESDTCLPPSHLETPNPNPVRSQALVQQTYSDGIVNFTKIESSTDQLSGNNSLIFQESVFQLGALAETNLAYNTARRAKKRPGQGEIH